MYILRSFKWVRRFFIVVFLIAIIILGYVGITSSMNGQSMNGFELFIDFLLALLFAIILIFSRYDEIVFTDIEIRYMKRNKIIKAIKWENYNTVSFKRGYQGNVVVTLIYQSSNGDGSETEEGYGYSEYHLLFSWWFLETTKGKELVKFLEDRYGVSFKECMNRNMGKRYH